MLSCFIIRKEKAKGFTRINTLSIWTYYVRDNQMLDNRTISCTILNFSKNSYNVYMQIPLSNTAYKRINSLRTNLLFLIWCSLKVWFKILFHRCLFLIREKHSSECRDIFFAKYNEDGKLYYGQHLRTALETTEVFLCRQ